MFGIALARCDVPDQLIRKYHLGRYISVRHAGADEEVHFLSEHRPRVLPVWMDGQLQILPWGRHEMWCPREALESGSWPYPCPKDVIVPASFAFDRGVWYPAHEGLKGAVVDMGTHHVVFLLSQPATHYYQVMTRQSRMPVAPGPL